MIERVAWIFHYCCIPSRIGVRAQSEQHFTRVMHVAIFIHGDDVLAEHHLAHSPEAMHDLESLIGILLSNADENQIMKDAFGRQRHVHDFRKIHFQDGQ